MKYFVCSDIHSFYDEWMEALDNAGFDYRNNDHCIILCGDLLDRGERPLECLEFVCDLIDQNRIICIMGNHETLLYDLGVYSHGWFSHSDKHNGTDKTVYALANGDPLNMPENVAIDRALTNPLWRKYFNECDKHWYYETNHYIFVHSWVPGCDNWRDLDDLSVYHTWWNFAVWGNPYEKWLMNDLKGIDGKTVVFGHWHTSWAWHRWRWYDKEFLDKVETMWLDSEGVIHPTVCYDIFEDTGIIGLDACTVNSHKVNILVLEEL